MKTDPDISSQEEWLDRCRRQLKRKLRDRIDYGFVYTYKPVLDDVSARIFDSMKEYNLWCEKYLPRYLGYHKYETRKSV